MLFRCWSKINLNEELIFFKLNVIEMLYLNPFKAPIKLEKCHYGMCIIDRCARFDISNEHVNKN